MEHRGSLLMVVLTVLAAMTVLLGSAQAHTVMIAPEREGCLLTYGLECFVETIHRGDSMTVSFAVTPSENDGGSTSDFYIKDPQGMTIYNKHQVTNGEYNFEAEADGTYQYCFDNRLEHQHWTEVTFNVHGVIYVSAEQRTDDGGLTHEVQQLGQLLDKVRDEQEYIVIREQTHRNTAESTNTRVKWWGLFQTGVVVGVCLFQVMYLKRFFEVKRIV